MSSLEAFADLSTLTGIEAFLALDQTVLEAIPSGTYVCSADGVLLRYNSRAAEMWGRNPRAGADEKFCGSFRLYDAEGRPLPHAHSPMEATLRSGVAERNRELMFERPDGSRVVVLVSVEPFKGPTGRVQGAIASMVDITARKRADEEAREREYWHRQVLDALPAAIYATDTEGRVRFYNREAAALAGREPELGKDEWCVTWRLYTNDGLPLPHDECPMAVALKEKRPVRGGQAIAERPDGRRFPFQAHPTPIYDRHNTMVGAVNMLVDLTDRQQAEQAQQRLISIVEQSDDAIVSKDLDGTIKSWNKGAEKLFGYTADEIVGKSVLTLIPEELQHEEPKILDRIRHGERLEHYETIRRRKDGSRIDISLSISPVKDHNGRIIGASKIARDITARKRAEHALAVRADEQAALYEFTLRLHRAETQADIYDAALDCILRALRCNRASILLADNEGTMRFVAWRNLSEGYRSAVDGHSPWEPNDPRALPILIEDLSAAALPDDLKATVAAEGIGALAFIPLHAGGRLIGKFMIYYDAPHVFSRDETDLSLNIARQLGFSIDRRRTFDARRAAEESLRESERRLELALTAGRMGAWEWNIATGEVIWSPVLERIHGREPGTFGRRFEDFKQEIHPDDFDEVLRQISHSVETGAEYHVVYRARHVDGTTRWLEAFGRAVIGVDGKPHKLAGVCMDITERKLTEAALRAREAELESIINRTPFMLTRCTRDLRYGFVSTAYAAMHGLVPEDIMGRPIAEVIGEEAFEVIRPYAEKVLAGQQVEYESEVPFKTVGTRHVHVVYMPERDGAGRITGWIASILDITERKQAEAQRDLLVAELSHRVKNTLATVISIARQSFSKGPSIEEARRSFDGRILALAQTHGRLAEENWSGVSLETILMDEFAPYRTGDNIRFSGPSLTLSPKCALVLGMTFHELATNAAKYGALATQDGVVNVNWTVQPDQKLLIHWAETGGPTVRPPKRSGFGRLLLERALASDLRGEVKLNFDKNGVQCDIEVPLDGHVAYLNRGVSIDRQGQVARTPAPAARTS